MENTFLLKLRDEIFCRYGGIQYHDGVNGIEREDGVQKLDGLNESGEFLGMTLEAVAAPVETSSPPGDTLLRFFLDGFSLARSMGKV